MTRPKLRQLNPAARARSVSLGAPVRTLGAAPAVKVTLEFYGSAAWKALVRKVIKERGRRCQDINCRTPHRGQGKRIYCDHVRELADGGASLDERNVLLRCAQCHGRKTAAEREARAARDAGGRAPNRGRERSTAVGSSLESAPRPAAFFPTRNRQ